MHALQMSRKPSHSPAKKGLRSFATKHAQAIFNIDNISGAIWRILVWSESELFSHLWLSWYLFQVCIHNDSIMCIWQTLLLCLLQKTLRTFPTTFPVLREKVSLPWATFSCKIINFLAKNDKSFILTSIMKQKNFKLKMMRRKTNANQFIVICSYNITIIVCIAVHGNFPYFFCSGWNSINFSINWLYHCLVCI